MNLPDTYKKILVEISRVLVGVVFVFSGFVKAIDPLGNTYKIVDYLEAFGMGFFEIFALPAAIFLSAFEFALGAALLIGAYRRIHSILLLLFMCFMTPLTLYLAIANPVSDCGCFGDAIVITNWQTFFKNVVLLAASVCIFFWSRFMTPLFTKKTHSLPILFAWVFIFVVSVYCYVYLPILDFRPYKIGNDIPALMEVPEGEPVDKYETTFIYAKEGVEKEFTLEDYPRGDASWTFVDSKSTLVEKGYEPPIHDFTIVTEDDDDITEDVLDNPSYTFLLIAYKLENAVDANVDKINEIYDFATQYGYDFYCLTASLPENITNWRENTGAEYPFCITDEITLKTIVRSNPGLMLIKDGTIINKWSDRQIPSGDILTQDLDDSLLGEIPPNCDDKNIGRLVLLFMIPMLALFIFDFFYYRRKNNSNK